MLALVLAGSSAFFSSSATARMSSSSTSGRLGSSPSAMAPAVAEMAVLPALSHDEIRRYSRHLILDDVGVEGQRRLKAARVLCIGSGGLGSPALVYLAAAGVGTLGVVDNDVVDESNLHRQIIHSTDSVGLPKVESAEERVRQINPTVKFISHHAHLDASNALQILGGYDIVVDGSDNFPTRYLVNDACIILGLPLVYGAVQKFEGQISLFNLLLPDGSRGPTYRDLFPDPPPPGAVPSCAEGGVLGVLPGVIGTMQATEAIKVILGVGQTRPRDTLSGRLLLYNAMSVRFHEVAFKPRECHSLQHQHTNCSRCFRPRECEYAHAHGFSALIAAPGPAGGDTVNRSPAAAFLVHSSALSAHPTPPCPLVAGPDAPKIEALIDYTGFCGQAAAEDAAATARAAEQFVRIRPAEAWRRMEAEKWAPFVLDVRTKREAEVVSLPFADLQYPHRQVAAIVGRLPAEGDILVHCKSGIRSAAACHSLVELGVAPGRLFSLDGGIIAWAGEVDKAMPTY
jgi:adenylyltransferase/sulfurtransferase